MKKILFLVAVILLAAHTGFAQTICTPNFYDSTQHSTLSDKGKQVDDYFNMVNASLQSIAQNEGDARAESYSAIIHAVYDNNNSIDNNAIINQDTTVETYSYSMRVTGIVSAYKCIHAIEKWMNEHHTNDANIHVHRNSDGSVTVTWG